MEKRRGFVCPSWLARPAYFLFSAIVFPLVLALGWPFLLLKEKRRKTLLPRLGFQPYPKTDVDGPGPVWIHALSVGELLSAVPLIEGLRARLGDARPIVVSVSTLSGRLIAGKRLEGKIDGLFYFPYDTPLAYRRCFSRIRPDLFVLVETDVWPGYLSFFRSRGIPCVLVNGRLTERSFCSFARWWSLFGPAFAVFRMIYPQSVREASRFRDLGVGPDRLGRPGNLKFDANGGSVSEDGGRSLRKILGFEPNDRILIAGSTHAGEERTLLEVFARLRGEVDGLKLILVPRHPERGLEVRDICRASGFEVALLTDRRIERPDVVVVDRLGFLGRFYPLAEMAFVGGSIVPKGGQNPIEPALAGKPIVFGPDMSDFPDIAPELVERGGARVITDGDALHKVMLDWLMHRDEAAEAGAKALEAVEAHRGITDHLVEELVELLAATSSASGRTVYSGPGKSPD
ncbi:MAG: 3-deoxy-D-manno-octulosonic acid transferase [Opitutaceae bacterium]